MNRERDALVDAMVQEILATLRAKGMVIEPYGTFVQGLTDLISTSLVIR